MTGAIATVRDVAALRAAVRAWRARGERVALVPTMGALHEGHLRLVDVARSHAERVVTSIFVNPLQFGANEDLARYPRTEAADAAALAARRCDLLYAPGVEAIYPAGFRTTVHVADLGGPMEGEARPGHFDGVATVVAKLLTQAAPDIAVFGEKDYQQLQVIRRMAADLDLPTAILGVPTVRDSDGLALSSRNAYLSAEQRSVAAALPRIMRETMQAIAAGKRATAALVDGRVALLASGFDTVDYLDLRDAETLAPVQRLDRGARLFAAARLGTTRLIDNLAHDAER